jgi:hypothetical protein
LKVEIDLREDGHFVGIRLYPQDADEMSTLKMLEKYNVPVKFEEIFGNHNPYHLLVTVEPNDSDGEKNGRNNA